MNDIITNGTEIKKRIISEINNSSLCIYLAMAWFTDRDIANALIDAKNRKVNIDIILSSTEQNGEVKQMFRDADIGVHAFATGDKRGIMYHKFCLIDNRISINGSYNYSFNASNNNVENIHVSDDFSIYTQLLKEFRRLKFNIENNIEINSTQQGYTDIYQPLKPQNSIDAFARHLSNLVYSSAQINTDDYKKQGFEKSKESQGNIDIFKTEYANIKAEICTYATDDSLTGRKNILTSNINAAYASKKSDLEADKQNEINTAKSSNELEKKQISDKNAEIRKEKEILESGNAATDEKGLLQINKEIEQNKLERKTLEQSFVVKKFWTIGTVFALIGLCIFIYYLSIFFASAIYMVFFEENFIRASLEAGINPGLPQLVDANAIIKIFKQQGILFGLMAALFFLIPISLSNLKLLGNKSKWINILCFWIGVLIFDILVATMVAFNTDEIKSLLVGKESQLQIWEVVRHGEFYLIFVFGMFPLIITHFLINYVSNAYEESQREIVDAVKTRKIQTLDKEMVELNADKEYINTKIKEKDMAIKENDDKTLNLETEMNNRQNQIDNKYAELLKHFKTIFEDFNTKITSGKIFTDEILNSVISSFKSGFIEYLPNYYSENVVASRVKEIEQVK